MRPAFLMATSRTATGTGTRSGSTGTIQTTGTPTAVLAWKSLAKKSNQELPEEGSFLRSGL
jgi:hypothetical protein